jgi:hypothetical protein
MGGRGGTRRCTRTCGIAHHLGQLAAILIPPPGSALQ